MASVELDIANYMDSNVIPIDVIVGLIEGLDVKVENTVYVDRGLPVLRFSGTVDNLRTLIDRYETDPGLRPDLYETINDNE